MNNDLLYKLAVTFIPGIGPVLGKRLISYLGGAEQVFSATEKQLNKIPGIGEKLSDGKIRKLALEKAAKELENLEKLNIKALFYLDNDYPETLKQYEDSPIILYVKGNTQIFNNQQTLAIVGTRSPTLYGKQACQKIISGLVEKGIKPVIISGLAYGIDICAHTAALEKQLPTIAVLANGLNTVYPASHTKTAEKILQNGLLISENPTTTKLEPKLFVRRNRIIAALSQAVVIVQSGIKGGALITAEYANLYKKPVFAIPGNITDEKSAGCNSLIKNNKAKLLDSAVTLIEEMNWKTSGKQTAIPFPDLSDEENKVIKLLEKHEKMYIDKIAGQLNWDFNKILSTLFQLELKGLIEQLPGNFYALKSR